MKRKDKRMIRGFQLMAAYYHDGDFSKASYHELCNERDSPSRKKDWKSLKTEDWKKRKFEEVAKAMYTLLAQVDYFHYLGGWNWSILKSSTGFIPEAATIAFYIGLIKHYEALGKPTSITSKAGITFKKNSYLLLDKLIYESINGQWRGSGDKLGQQQIQEMKDIKGLMSSHIKDKKWKEAWKMIVGGKENFDFKKDNPSISKFPNGKDMANESQEYFPAWVKRMMIHYYCTKGIESFLVKSPYNGSKIEWDHLIPRKSFTSGSSEEKFRVNIANCAALPKHTNNQKSTKTLNDKDCKTAQTYTLLKEYAEIDTKTEGHKYDEVSKIEDLIKYRGKKLMDNFITSRKKYI